MKKKNIAVVTGASSGIGQAVSRKLCEAGYEVYGFGREFEKKEGIRHGRLQKKSRRGFIRLSVIFWRKIPCFKSLNRL